MSAAAGGIHITRADLKVTADALDDQMRYVAAQLESDNPLWIVVFGVYTRQFIAFPRFQAPAGAVLSVRYPAAMPARMREIEHEAAKRRTLQDTSDEQDR